MLSHYARGALLFASYARSRSIPLRIDSLYSPLTSNF